MKRMKSRLSLVLILSLLTTLFISSFAENVEILFDLPDDEGVAILFDEQEVEAIEIQDFEIDDPNDVIQETMLSIRAEADETVDDISSIKANAGSTLDTAMAIEMGFTYNGAMTETNIADFYRFTLPSSGCLTLSATAKMEYVYYYLYDASGNQRWESNPHWNSTTRESVISPDLHLLSGTYYLAVKKDGSRNGEYNFRMIFESANETFHEEQGNTNNSIENASEVPFETTVLGQLAINDSKDFYKFVLSTSGKVSLSATAKMEYLYYYLYDVTGNQLWKSNPHWNSTTMENTISSDLYLISGTYYLVMEKDGSRFGNYGFSLSFESANETFYEEQGNTNNSIENANEVAFDTTVLGQLAINDTKDFLKIILPTSGRVSLFATAKMEYLYYYLYNENGNQLWKTNPHWNSTTRENTINPTLDLIKGTYYLALEKDGSRYGNYSLKLSFESAEESFTETGVDNSIDGANAITIGNTYRGQLAINDSKDFYQITLANNDELAFILNADCEYAYMSLYERTGSQIWTVNPHWNTTTRRIEYEKKSILSAGIYYVCIYKDGDRTANYTLRVAAVNDPEEPTSTVTPTPDPTATPTPDPTATPTTKPTAAPTSEPVTDLIDIDACDIDHIPDQVYSGKKIMAEVEIEYDGETLVENIDFKLSYKNNKNIGLAIVTIKGIGKYTGTVEQTFKINPKAVSLKKLTRGKKKLTVQWKMGAGSITGYQIQYSTKKGFSSQKTVIVKGKKTVKKTIANLKAKKTYYIRIRAYKKVSGEEYYSDWSKTFSAKTK